ncbi:MAG: LptA/OstA family protein [Acetobacteraceae bacterium]
MGRGAVLLVLFAAAVLPAGAARAQALDFSRGGPIAISAAGGMEWRQAEREVIAKGDARAVRNGVTVTADRLIAHYRAKAAAPGATAATNPAAGTATLPDTQGNQIYLLEAVGNVHIFTATDQAVADHAVYDLDQQVLVLTGGHLRLTSPADTLTARDSIEYWAAKRMAVARGDALLITNSGRRLSADTLVGYTSAPTAPATPAGTTPAGAGAVPADPLAASGRLRRVDAIGHVVITTATTTATGDRGVYDPATGIARLAGHVRITRGANQLNGAEAVVDLKTGVAQLIAAPGGRVNGLVLPKSAPGAANPGGANLGAAKPGAAKPPIASPGAGPAGSAPP